MKFKFLLGIYIALLICLWLYSFTQIDLNLTISSNNIWQTLQKNFQHIGYYQRSLSTLLFTIIVMLFLVINLFFLTLAKNGKIQEKQVWQVVVITILILLISYPAFSYDIFNYLFNARMMTKYGVDPYVYRALDFPNDPWIRFMRWTHVTTPYPWGWTLLGVIPSLLGFQIFIITLLNFKLLMAVFYLGTIYLMGKIMEKEDSKNKITAMVFIATNPLIVIESLVSGHHEIVMIFFAMVSLYLLFIERKTWQSLLFLGISISIKYMTLFLFPIWFIKKLKLSFVLMGIGLFLFQVIYNREFQPWYFLWVLPFLPLMSNNSKILFVFSLLSAGCLLRYVPYLYYGNWDWPVMWAMNFLTLFPVTVYLIVILIFKTRHNEKAY